MRKLTPELLDHLPHDDPGAMRSRRDLRRINFFMGNWRWILSEIPEHAEAITEIGAGDGHLLPLLAKKRPGARIAAYDLAPRPPGLPESVEWIQGDLFSQPPPASGGTLIANLFLHHFTDAQLAELGAWMRPFEKIIMNEPMRSKLPLLIGKIAYPLIDPITRHDMRVSIEAGFAPGELAASLCLETNGFRFRETRSYLGSLRLVAEKD
jgi:hypothetical protein